tara:strand:+ start:245 stop:433 length:189 start_codon:yes stop_codon:yes gene_type:complete
VQFLIEIVGQIVIVRRNKMKAVPKGNKGLAKLPKAVRNKMGYMKKGGSVKKMKRGGVAKKKK